MRMRVETSSVGEILEESEIFVCMSVKVRLVFILVRGMSLFLLVF